MASLGLIDVEQPIMEKTSTHLPFKKSQIICLEHTGTCLYGEVIQLIPERNMCWFRPIFMTIPSDQNLDLENQKLIHFQSSSDLLWPICLFRPALDTEVIDLLGNFHDLHKEDQLNLSSRQHLNQFVRKVWSDNQDKF